MERRSKNRHDLQLVCHIGETKVLSATPEQGSRALEAMTAKGAVEATTENMSRDGMLMRWLDGVPLPEIGTILTVEVDLPGGEDFGPRVMRCQTTVVRITGRPGARRGVGLRIDRVRFSRPAKRKKFDLESMRPATDKVI